jgi:hypothetical protein
MYDSNIEERFVNREGDYLSRKIKPCLIAIRSIPMESWTPNLIMMLARCFSTVLTDMEPLGNGSISIAFTNQLQDFPFS